MKRIFTIILATAAAVGFAGHPFAQPDAATLPFRDGIAETATAQGVTTCRLEIDGRKLKDGSVSRIYVIYARPAAPGKYPVLLHLHGAGQTADAGVVQRWAARGYAAATFDWTSDPGGKYTGKRPFSKFGKDSARDNNNAMFPTDGADSRVIDIVISARRVIDWMGRREECDTARLGVSGISWGGFASLLLAGVEPRVRAVSDVYGAGFFPGAYRLTGPLIYCTKPDAARWLETFDPSRFLAGVKAPVQLISGTNDLFFPMPLLMKSYEALPGAKQLVLYANQNHNIPVAETERQAAAWFAHFLENRPVAYPELEQVEFADGAARGRFRVPVGSKAEIELHYVWSKSAAGLDNPKLAYRSRKAEILGQNFNVKLPDEAPDADTRTLGYYFNCRLENGLAASSRIYTREAAKVKAAATVGNTAPEETAMAAAENRFADPSFEKQRGKGYNGKIFVNPQGTFTVEETGANARSGKRAVVIGKPNFLTMAAGGNLEPGATYRFGLYAKAVEGEGKVQLQINFLNGSGKLVSYKLKQQKVNGDGFTGVWMEERVPEGAVNCILFVQGGHFYADDFEFGKK